jgi:hypothetical protein
MNKYLKVKNEEFVRQNSADFYVMSIYSSLILKKDFLRIEEFKKFCKDRNGKNKNKFDKSLVITNLFISAVLVYRFKSFLIIPVFYSTYYFLNYFLAGKNLECYHCEKQKIKQNNLTRYENYYNLINYCFEKNPKIKNIDDFEKELDRIIKDLKF